MYAQTIHNHCTGFPTTDMLIRHIVAILSIFLMTFYADAAEGRPRQRPGGTVKTGEKKPGNQDSAESEKAGELVEIEDYNKLAAQFSSSRGEKKQHFFHSCKHIKASSMQRVLEDFVTAQGRVSASEESDLVVVNDVESNIAKLKEIADRLDQHVAQILVEAQIVELTLDDDFEKEVNLAFKHIAPGEASFVKEITSLLTTPGANPTKNEGSNLTFRPYVYNYDDGKRNELTTFFRYLETKGKAKILSAPNLILRRGSEGSIITGEEVPILEQRVVEGSVSTTTVFKPVGIQMRVKPHIITKDNVRLHISPSVSTVTGFTTAGDTGIQNPIIAVRKATTELDVKNGELISIGGLLSTKELVTKKRVPIAAAIPGVGHLFRATRVEKIKTHLVILLRISILDESQPNSVRIHEPEEFHIKVKEKIESMDVEKPKPPGAQILHDFEKLKGS